MSMKNPLTPAGIEPATYRIVAQHLDHCATAVPGISYKFKGDSAEIFRLTECQLFFKFFFSYYVFLEKKCNFSHNFLISPKSGTNSNSSM